MKTLLFVHGTGVRQAGAVATLNVLRERATEHLPGWRIEGCGWGEIVGARLLKDGASIPGYGQTGNAAPAAASAQQALWTLLVGDPLLELRIAPVRDVFGDKPGKMLWPQVMALAPPPPGIQEFLAPLQLVEAWGVFIRETSTDAVWKEVIESQTAKPQDLGVQIARALVAGFQKRLRWGEIPALTRDQREALTARLAEHLGSGMGLSDWMLNRLTNWAVDRRGRLMDAVGGIVGDILRYQARGAALRKFIGECVASTKADAILAHSLGGIACVEWLAETQLEKVPKLITVGSQAPYFYEIDALSIIPWNSGLPPHFPPWLNIYDEKDVLSYQGHELFGDIIVDRKVDNGQPFPDAHSAYWRNEECWKHIKSFLIP